MDYGFVKHDYHPAPALFTYRCISSLIFFVGRGSRVSSTSLSMCICYGSKGPVNSYILAFASAEAGVIPAKPAQGCEGCNPARKKQRAAPVNY